MSTTTADYRLDWILHEGDAIQTADAIYTITGEPIGFGGSSVLYPASKSGSHLDYAIKECFPAKPAVYQRTKGIVRTADPNDELNQGKLTEFRKMISREKELGQEIRNTTTRAVSVWDEFAPVSITTGGEVFHEVSDGGFSILERMDKKGRFFNELLSDIRNACPPEDRCATFGLPSIHMTVQIMEQALLALQQVHNAGYYYGDLNGSNVFFSECEPGENRIGIGYLIDFGSTRKLESDGFTAPIIDGPIFSTDGFRPPEISNADLFNENGFPVLSKRSDIFSMGCLMLRCVLSPAKIKTLDSSLCIGSNALSEVNSAAIGCTEKTRKIVNSILDKATKYNPKDRYADATEMLVDIHALMEYIRPPKNHLNLSFSTLAPGEFRGREEEIKEIDRRISEHRKPIELYGFGGMGKSELAIEYCRRKMDSSGIHIHFVRFDKTIRNTIVGPIAEAFSGYDRITDSGILKTEQTIYSEVMKMLGEQSEDDILCIDNVDSETTDFAELCGKEYEDLCRLKMNIIITTRFDRKEFGGIEVGALQRKHLHGLMTYILKDSPVTLTEKQMDDLIQAVDSHTLAVELIARTLKTNRPRLTPEALIENLNAGDLGGTSFAKIASHKDRDLQKRRIEDHIKKLFQITNLPSDELSYIKNAVLMDINHGFPYDWFAEAQPNFDQDMMQHLLDRGWIKIQGKFNLKNFHQDKLNFHPLVHNIARSQFPPNMEDNMVFLNNLWAIFQRYKSNGGICRPIVNLFISAEDLLPDTWIDELCNWYDVLIDRLKLSIAVGEQRKAAREMSQIGEFNKALMHINSAFEIVQNNKDKFYSTTGQTTLGELYLLEGEVYKAASNYEKMLECFITAAKLGHAPSMNRLANHYIDGDYCPQDYAQAIFWLQQSHSLNNATGSNNLGWMYLHGYGIPKDVNTAIQLFITAATNEDSPSGAANRHLGRIFLGVHPDVPDYPEIDPEKALVYLQKAKKLGRTDVDELIAKAHSMLETTN